MAVLVIDGQLLNVWLTMVNATQKWLVNLYLNCYMALVLVLVKPMTLLSDENKQHSYWLNSVTRL